jgi:hypothetical protein
MPPFASVSKVGRGHPFLVSLVKTDKKNGLGVHRAETFDGVFLIRIPLRMDIGQTP